MKGLIKKILIKLSFLKVSNESELEVENIETNTVNLRKGKKSDVSRWSNNNQLFQDWNERTALLGDFIKPNARIIEFGAGNMFLKEYLKNYKNYTPSDIVKRFDETVVCDLNKPLIIDLSKFDTIVFSGVLEYVYDIESLFYQLKYNRIHQVVMSYCCSDIVTLSRDKNGWLSDYTKKELETIFKKYNYKIEDYTEWKKQSLFNLVFQY
tara:strand:- start:159 stop:785 length:627 start_codon:yes stop_codon:yes gene_type:complete